MQYDVINIKNNNLGKYNGCDRTVAQRKEMTPPTECIAISQAIFV